MTDKLQAALDRAGGHYAAGRLALALALYQDILKTLPDQPEILNRVGDIFWQLGRLRDSLSAFSRAAQVKPDYAAAIFNMGKVFLDLGMIKQSTVCYRKALTLDPGHADGVLGHAYALALSGDLGQALGAFERAAELDPARMTGPLVYFQLAQCNWTALDDRVGRILDGLSAKRGDVSPFSLLAVTRKPEHQLLAARAWTARQCPDKVKAPAFRGRAGAPLRVGYLSEEFRQHPVTQLLTDMLERHDRARFQLFGYCYGPDEEDDTSRRIGAVLSSSVNLRELSHAEAARRIAADKIDILVDLTGYTRFARPQILAFRPAPVQVSYLGFPGTMGAPFIDYIIADPYLVPFDRQPFYAEKIVHLPHCYQPSDTARMATPTSRAAEGLPKEGMILAAFNNTNKITPAIFSTWMRLLARHPKAVLWLFAGGEAAEANLRREAAVRGVDPARLVFARRVGFEAYLGRLALADLFLDCHPYNAGATANDALWMGLPVLTCSGETYVSRMAGSLLSTLGLPELIATDLADYEARADALLADPARLAAVKARLGRARETAPLFDMERYARHLEAAFTRMAELARAGSPPQPFAVAP